MDSTQWHRQLLLGIHFTVYTDNNAIIYLLRKTEVSTRVMWWIIALSKYNAKYYYLSEYQNIVADALSRNPSEGQEDTSEESEYNRKYVALCKMYNVTQERESYDYEDKLLMFICAVTELHFDAILKEHYKTI